jgi:hypothetical protein
VDSKIVDEKDDKNGFKEIEAGPLRKNDILFW